VRAEARNLAEWLAKSVPDAPPIRPLICFVGDSFDEGLRVIDEITICNSARLVETIVSAPGTKFDKNILNRVVERLAQQV